MSEVEIEEEEAPDLRAEGMSVARSPRTLFSALSLFAPTAYAGAVVLRDSPHPFWARVLLGVSGLVAVARLAPRIDELAPEARRPGRLALVSATVAGILALGLPMDGKTTSGFAVSAIGAAASLAAGGALSCAAAIHGLGGLGATPRNVIAGEARKLSFAWFFVALVFALSRWPLAAPFAGEIDAPAAALVIALSSVHLGLSARRRRHELGARERHELLLGTATLVLPAAVFATNGLSLGSRPHAEWLPLLFGPPLAVAVLVAQLVADPVRASARVGRTWVLLTAAAVTTSALLFWDVSSMVAMVVGIAIGVVSQPLARKIGLEGEHEEALRTAIAKAREASATPDPNEVARGVLSALRILGGGSAPVGGRVASPRLLLFSPLREVLLDAAGEARMRDPMPTGESIPDPDAPSPLARVLPEGLLRMVAEEPLGVVRIEVLRSVEVRRPDVRAVLRWCDARDAAAIVAVVVDGELDGLLLFSSGPHTADLGLRHVRALRAIARMSAMRLSLEAALARASARAQRAEHRARDVEHVLDRTQDREQRLASGVAAAARPLAARVATIGYAPGSRALLAELDALAKTPANLAVVHRPGTDPVPWIARLHVESKRSGAFVVIDASREDPAHWSDPVRSPIELARNGTLLVLAAASLPREAQKRLISALAFHEGPGADPSPVDVRVVLASGSRDPENAALASIDPSLLAHVRPSPVRIAPLARRIEDLHALALDRLVAIAGSLGRPPLGLAPDALELLIEHSWPGDDVELESVLVLAATSAGDAPRIERRHLESLLRA
jgi:hypothetical protein